MTKNKPLPTIYLKSYTLLHAIFVTGLIVVHGIGNRFALWDNMLVSSSCWLMPFVLSIPDIVEACYGQSAARYLLIQGVGLQFISIILLSLIKCLPVSTHSPIAHHALSATIATSWATLWRMGLACSIKWVLNGWVRCQRNYKAWCWRGIATWIVQNIDRYGLAYVMYWWHHGNLTDKTIFASAVLFKYATIQAGYLLVVYMPIVYGIICGIKRLHASYPIDPITLAHGLSQRTTQAFIVLIGWFVMVLTMTNMVTAYHFTCVGWLCTAGAVTYPLTFFVMDIIAECYTNTHGYLAIVAGLMTNIILLVGVWLAGKQSIHPDSLVTATVFQNVWGWTGGIVLASLSAFIIGQWMDFHVFRYVRQATHGKKLWLRNNVSTLLSQIVDTGVFCTVVALCYWQQGLGAVTWTSWFTIARNELMLKGILALLDTPFVYLTVALWKNWTGMRK